MASITYDLWRKQNPSPKLESFLYSTGAVPGGASAVEGISAVLINITSIFGLNTTGTARYLQLFSQAPANNDIPDVSIYVPANANFSWTPTQGGRVFDALYFGVSSTAADYTSVAANFVVYVEGQVVT